MSKSKFLLSLREFRNVSGLVTCGLFIALYVVLNFQSIYITPTIKLTFAFLALALLGWRLGPVIAAFAGGIADILGFLVRPMDVYNPGLMLSVMLSAFVFGLFFYRQQIVLWKVILSRTIISIFLHLFLNTYWLSLLLGKGYLAMFPARVVKTLILLPVEIVLIFAVLKIISSVEARLRT